jgi:hypothetical protein
MPYRKAASIPQEPGLPTPPQRSWWCRTFHDHVLPAQVMGIIAFRCVDCPCWWYPRGLEAAKLEAERIRVDREERERL